MRNSEFNVIKAPDYQKVDDVSIIGYLEVPLHKFIL